MGYAGYFSTTSRLKDKATPLQAALGMVVSMESLQILEKLCYNTAVMPKELKYRSIKLSNKKISATIAQTPEAMAVLKMLGWEDAQGEEGEAQLKLPEGKTLTMAQVRDIQDAQKELTKKERDMKRSSSAASLPGSSAQRELRSLIENDRKEVAQA